jgi:hypothetical protein
MITRSNELVAGLALKDRMSQGGVGATSAEECRQQEEKKASQTACQTRAAVPK